MTKNVLVLSGSPRIQGNSDILCDEFIKGAKEKNHKIEKVYINKLKIDWCQACYACKKTGKCCKNDDMAAILEKIINADVIVLSTPVYFYSMSGQMKTFIDRTLPLYYKEISAKYFYFIVTAAEDKHAIERAVESLKGFTDCVNGADVKGILYGDGVYEKGEVKNSKHISKVYAMGQNI